MNQRESAAWETHYFFDHLEVQYVIIGGLTNPEIVEQFERPWRKID